MPTGGITDRFTHPPGDAERCIPRGGVFAFADLAAAADTLAGRAKKRSDGYVVSAANMDRLRLALDEIRGLHVPRDVEQGRNEPHDSPGMLVLDQQAHKVVRVWEEVGAPDALTPELEGLREALRILGEQP